MMKERPTPDGGIARFPAEMPDTMIDQIMERDYGVRSATPGSGLVQADADASWLPAPRGPEPKALSPVGLATNLPGDAYEAGAEFVENIKHPIQGMEDLGDLAAGYIGRLPFSRPSWMPDVRTDEKRRMQQLTAEGADQMISDNFGTPTRAWNTIVENPFDAGITAVPIVGQLGKLAKISGAAKTAAGLEKAASAMNPVNWVGKPLVSAKRGIQDMMLEQGEARKLRVPRRSMNRVGESIGDVTDAREVAKLIGGDGIAAALSPQATQDARRLAAMSLPDGSSKRLATAASDMENNAKSRALTDWQNATGPAQSKFNTRLKTKQIKSGTSNLYEIAKGRPIVDPGDIIDEIPKLVDAVKNNSEGRARVAEINDMLIDPRSGEFITDAGELVNVRQRISEMITELGRVHAPLGDAYEAGTRTSVGSKLSQLRKKINDTLHLDQDLAEADATWSGAENKAKAYQLGNEKVIGRGGNMAEDQDIAAWASDPSRTLDELAEALKGLSQRGKADIGDIAASRNEGKAFGNKFGTDNNIARMEALGVDGNIVRRMTERENLLGDTSNTILRGSDTQRTALAQKNYPEPDKGNGLTGPSVTGIGTGGAAAALAQVLSPDWMGIAALLAGGGAAGGSKLYNLLKNKSTIKTNQGSADLFSRSGPAVKQLLDALERVKQGKSSATPWKDPGILQALIAAQIAGSAKELQRGPR